MARFLHGALWGGERDVAERVYQRASEGGETGSCTRGGQRTIERIFNFQMKFILVMDYKDNYGLFDDQARDIVQIAYKNEDNQTKKI